MILDIWLSFEYAWDVKCASVLNIPRRHSYNSIIIVTNVFVLEFLSAQIVHPGAPQLNVLPFFNTS